MFTKLNIRHTFKYQGESDTYIFYGSENNGNKIGYKGIQVNSPNVVKSIMSMIPINYHNGFLVDMIEITGGDLPPHRDANILMSVNFYIETGDGVTTFYKTKEGVIPRQENIMNETSGFVYNADDLEPVSQFVAEVGDIYLLDVKSIHSVKSDPAKPRRAYTLKSSEYTYHDVLQMLKERGFV